MNTEATRQILWNAPFPGLMYILLVPTAVIGFYGFYRRYRLWRCGRPTIRWDRPAERLRLLLRHGVGQRRTLKKVYAGLFHLMIYTGFLVLTIATLLVMLDHDFGTQLLQGSFYLYFQSLTVDLFGALVLVGVGMAAYRRWLKKPRRLVLSDEASLLLVAIFVIVATGFLLEGWRIAATEDPWGPWSPVGFLVAQASRAVLSLEALTTAHAVLWWLHLLLVFAFFAWAPYTKLAHVVTAPLNIFFANLDGYAKSLEPIDFERDDDEPFGVVDLAQFSWKALLDLDACTECGRCTAACPANAAGKSLSPRDIILDLRTLLHQNGDKLLAGRREGDDEDQPLIPILSPDGAFATESLWACTTCAACLEACPVYIEPLTKILDARRFLVMEEAAMPDTIAEAITSLEKRGHPYPGSQHSRLDWADGLDVPILSELEESAQVDVVLWVGCANAFLERNHKIVRALAQLLNIAGVRFAILGREERCTGDPARRMGNEFLFDSMARKNVSLLERRGVKKLLTSCPHCFNSFRNDYPHLGGDYEVQHHSTFLEELVQAGRLEPEAVDGKLITFHDPCYLGRYNKEYDAPRELVQISSNRKAVEMKKSRESSFCCGGGGGMAFVDEAPDQRVNRERARQAIATGAETVAVGCPFCMTMLEDGVKDCAGDQAPAVQDIAEILLDAVERSTR
jgi:Fe-S oxidoreductase/nitrate reductase gamma subunit